MKKLVLLCVATSFLLVLLLPASAGAYIFWSSYDSGNSRVGRAGLDASEPKGDLVDKIYFGAGVATDGTYVYWGESGDASPRPGYVGRARVDGTEVNRNFQAAGNYCGIFGLRASASELFWMMSDCSGSGGRPIERAAKTGGAAASQVGGAPYACGFDVGAGYVYWSESHYIARAALPGPSTPEHTWLDVGTGYEPCAVAVNGTHVYWTNAKPVTEYRGTSIGRAAISGAPSSVEKEFLVGTTFFTEPSLPSGIAAEGDFLYWTNQPAVGSVFGSIGRANLDGTGVDYSFVDNVFDPVSLDVDSQGPAPAPALTTPKPVRPPPQPPRIVFVDSSNSTWAPGGGSTPARARVASISKKRVPRGTVFTYSLDQDAAMTIDVRKLKAGRVVKGKCKKAVKSNKKKKKCDLTAHTLSRSGKSGRNEVPYTGRVKGKVLTPGRYKAFFTAQGAGGKSQTVSVGFKIVKP